jgi:hypothetical protein
MDLSLFIILIIFSFMIYYLIRSIQSLLQEIKEVKMKCITTKNANIEDFRVETEDPAKVIKNKAVGTLARLQKMFL